MLIHLKQRMSGRSVFVSLRQTSPSSFDYNGDGTLIINNSFQSGRRDSNPRHSAWEADTLPTELRPQLHEDIPKLIKFCFDNNII